jgi:effector-binding domain-containing protein
MIEKPQIVQTTEQHYAYKHVVATLAEIPQVMGPGLREVQAALAEQGVTPSGPWFTHHRRNPAETFDFEICLPVDEPIQPAGQIEAGVWPSTRVVQTVYHGDYSGLPAAWGEFEAWIAAQGLNKGSELWERYIVDFSSTKNPEEWRTEMNRPLLD